MRAALLLVLLALLAPTALAAPEQVHLGLPTEDPSRALSVLWVDPVPDPAPAVTIEGPTGPVTIPAVQVQGPSAGFVYEARLQDLAPGSAFTYRVGERSFTAHSAPGRAEPFTFVALGDMGVRSGAAATLAKVQELAPSFVLHAGDISYAQGDPVAWKAWFDLVEPVAAGVPWLTALGNHETYTEPAGPAVRVDPAGVAFYPRTGLEVATYVQRFGLPGNELWYSFDWGGAHILALDTFSRDTETEELPAAPEQLRWLERDLDAARDAAWVVAFLHEPPYSSNEHGDSARVQRDLLPLLERAGVDLVIGAHDHGYERTFPMRGGVELSHEPRAYAQGQGTVYVVTGGAGRSLYDAWQAPYPAHTAARHSGYHVLEVRVGEQALEARYVATGDDDGFEDSFRIERSSTLVRPASGFAVPSADLGLGLVLVGLLALARRR